MKIPIRPRLTTLLGNATQLTRRGRLVEATAAIQRALRGAGNEAVPVATVRAVRGEAALAPKLLRDLAPPLSPAVGRAPGRPAREETVTAHFSRGEYTAPSGSRGYKLFVPGGYADTRLPLVVMLHGCTQDPDDFAAGTRMNLLAQERGVVVLYPAQPPRSNSSRCWNWFQPGDQRRGHGEPALLAEMTRHIVATHAIDPAHVYVAGLSAGGAMAAILGREYPDLFAAIGVHSGLAPGAAHDVASAFAVMKSGASGSARPSVASLAKATSAPMIVFHGDRDATVHPDNATHVIGSQAGTLVRHDERGDAGRGYTRSIYTAPDGQVRAEHWRVHGAGHAWSGGSAEGSYTDALGPDASREMLRFFLDQPTRTKH